MFHGLMNWMPNWPLWGEDINTPYWAILNNIWILLEHDMVCAMPS
jgi:hypothetical protein